MKVYPVKTDIIGFMKYSIEDVLDRFVDNIKDSSIVAVTSKIVALCEGNAVKADTADKDELIKKEADYFIPKSLSRYDVYLTIKDSLLIPSAGVDESNAGGYYVMWPKNPERSAQVCRDFLIKKFGVQNIGVIITDSSPAPLRWGVTGRCIASCGFESVIDKVGKTDIFGHSLEMTTINAADALAAGAVLCMGETDECTPIAIIEDIPFIHFGDFYKKRDIDIDDDLFAPLLSGVKWESGK